MKRNKKTFSYRPTFREVVFFAEEETEDKKKNPLIPTIERQKNPTRVYVYVYVSVSLCDDDDVENMLTFVWSPSLA